MEHHEKRHHGINFCSYNKNLQNHKKSYLFFETMKKNSCVKSNIKRSLITCKNSAAFYTCMYVKCSTWRQVRPSTCITRVVHISVHQTKERSEVICKVLSSLCQWPYESTFHCAHRHKSSANTTTKHPHTTNSSQTVTAINGTEPSWELQILLQPKPVDKYYTIAFMVHSNRHTTTTPGLF